VPSLSMVYEVLARDLASPAFRSVGAEAKNLQRVMQEADAKMSASAKAATAEISASLAGLDRAHNAAALQYDRANQTMIKSDDSLIVMQRKMAASTGALLAEQKKAAAANVEMDAAMGKAQADLAAKTDASHASRVSAFKDLGKASAAALLIVGYESVKAATKFEASMARVQTMAGASAKELKFMSGAILDLSPKVGVGPDALAESLYHVESAGFRGQKALDMVTASAKLSALGQDDINSSTQAVVATLASNIKGVRDANDAAALILHTVGTGDMTMHQFTQALGTGILATASTVGLAFKDIGAAIATLTDNAIPADQAATKLRTSLLMMVNPSGPAIAALRSINMNSTQLAMDLQKPDGLKVALDDIRKHLNSAFPLNKGPVASIDAQRRAVDSYKTTLMGAGVSGKELDKMVAKYTEALKHGTTNTVLQEQAFAKMFGGSKNAGTMMVLFNEQLDRMNPKLASFGTATSRAAEMQAAWAKQQSTFKQQLKELEASLDVAKIKIGNELLPVLKTITGFMSNHMGVVKVLAFGIGTLLVAATVAWTAALLANPITWVVVGLVALGVAVYELIKHWKDVTAFAKRMWHDVAGFFERLWKDVSGFADRIANDVNGFFSRMWKDTTGFVSRMWHDVTGFFARMWKDITGFADRIALDVDGFFNRMGDGIRNILDHIGRFFHDHWRLLLTAATLGLGLIYIVIQDHWKQITEVTSRLWHDVTGFFKRIWDDVSGFVSRMWHDVAGFFGRLWNDVTGWVSRLWNDVFGKTKTETVHVTGVVSDHVSKVTGWFSRLWNDVTGWVSRLWRDVAGFFSRLAADVWAILKPFVDRIIANWTSWYHTLAGVASSIWHDVTGFFGSMRDGVVGIFDDMVGKIGRVWDRVKEITAVPIRWVVENVYDKGIVPLVHGIGGILHESSMSNLPALHFAGGGKIPGNHSRDDVPFYGTPGELVVPLPTVARFGGADALMSALGFGGGGGAGGHYFDGGKILPRVLSDFNHPLQALGDIGSFGVHAAKGIGHAVAHPLDTLKNLVQGALGTVAGPIIHGLERAADGVLGRMGGIGSNMSHMVHIVGDKLLDLINSNDSAYNAAQAAAAGGGAGGGPISWNGGSNTIGLIEQLARSLPGGNVMQVTSTYRQGGGSYHAKSEAVDFSNGVDTPAMMLFDQAWASKFGGSLAELIHAGGTNIKDGRVVDGNSFYGAATMAGHHNHVHVAISPESISRGGQALKAFAGGGAYPSQGGVSRWRGLVDSTLGELGLPTSLDAKVLRQIATESGGNPNAVQGIRDVNSASGDLARGLMQVIGGTFRANAGPYVGLGVYDPHANIYAGLHYAMGRYGPNLMGLGEGHGYDTGGILPSGGLGVNRSGRPERILSPGQTESFDRLVKLLERGGGGQARGPLVGEVHVHDNVGLDLVLRQAQFREHTGAF